MFTIDSKAAFVSNSGSTVSLWSYAAIICSRRIKDRTEAPVVVNVHLRSADTFSHHLSSPEGCRQRRSRPRMAITVKHENCVSHNIGSMKARNIAEILIVLEHG
jgi:hypothetical protein